jgi:hypothetical protein
MLSMICPDPGPGSSRTPGVLCARVCPTDVTLAADFSLLAMMFCAICCMSTKPRAATTTQDTAKVAVMTRSCSDPRQRSLTRVTSLRVQRRSR